MKQFCFVGLVCGSMGGLMFWIESMRSPLFIEAQQDETDKLQEHPFFLILCGGLLGSVAVPLCFVYVVSRYFLRVLTSLL